MPAGTTEKKKLAKREHRDTSVVVSREEIEELKEIAEKAAEEARKVIDAFNDPDRKA
jgi:hypothetical protein